MKLSWHLRIIQLSLVSLTMFSYAGCGSKSSDSDPDPAPSVSPNTPSSPSAKNNVSIVAGSLQLDPVATLARRTALTAATAYTGIGTNYSEVVVDGFKISLTGFSVGTGVFGTSTMTNVEVVDWSASPKELEIKDGFDGEVAAEANIPVGTYTWLQTKYLKDYSVKAYAYFDRNNDGTAEWTIYTTATGLKLVSGVLDMTTVTDYAYGLFSENNGATGSAATSGSITLPSVPFTVTAESKISLNLQIDSYRAFKAWDGREVTNWATNPPAVGATIDPTTVAAPGFPFNSAMVGAAGDTSKAYHFGSPAIARIYVPMFVTAAADSAKFKSETYLFASTSNFTPYNTTVTTIVFDASGVPVIGQVNGGDGNEHLHAGGKASFFEKVTDNSYSFYVGSTTGLTKPEWNDGGFYYNSDKTKATHQYSLFSSLTTVGGIGTIKLGNAPRCDDEYNYCVPDVSNVKTATNGATMTVHIKRVR